MRIAAIVEGDGEVAAVPILLHRLWEWRSMPAGSARPEIARPIRVRRDRFLNRPDEFARQVELARMKSGVGGWILILLDADDDCPATKGQDVSAAARALAPDRAISVVLANREYEAWFLAAAASLRGYRGFHPGEADVAVNAELPRDAKGWVRQRMASGSYGTITDQPAFTMRMDLQAAFERSRSFRKLVLEWDRQGPGSKPSVGPDPE